MRHIVVKGHNHWSDGTSGEYVCQPAGMLLQGSRGIMHKNIDNSFVLSSMVMKFCRGMCKDKIYTSLKGSEHWIGKTTGTRVPISRSAAARQQKCGHRYEDISSFSTSMVKPFYRCVYKYVNYNLTKGFDDWRHETVRTLILSIAAKLTAKTTTHIAEKHHHRSSIHHIWYKICSEEYKNKMGKMMGCSHQELAADQGDEGDGSNHQVGDNNQRDTTTFSSERITTTQENKEMYERSTNSRI